MPNGGMYDGAYGVLAGIEAVRTLREGGFACRDILEAVAFDEEEGNVVDGTFGSKSFAGQPQEPSALERGDTHYTPNADTVELRRAIGEKSYLAPQGYDPGAEIIVTCGGMGALSLLFLVLLDEGDEVLIQDPQWLNHAAQV